MKRWQKCRGPWVWPFDLKLTLGHRQVSKSEGRKSEWAGEMKRTRSVPIRSSSAMIDFWNCFNAMRS